MAGRTGGGSRGSHEVPVLVWVLVALFCLFVVVPLLHVNGVYLQGRP